jgi:hypothetical protein
VKIPVDVINIVDATRRRPALAALCVLATIYLGHFLVDRWIENTTFDCAQPPSGVIRFILSSSRKDVRIYEWHGEDFRQVDTTPLDKEMAGLYPKGSYYNPTFWGADVQGIDRQVGGAESLLSTPYAISPDRKKLVAGLGPEFNFSERIAFLNLSTSKVIGIVDFHEAINAVAWDPLSQAVVVLSHSETYGLNPLALLAATAGHPVPYANLTLRIVEPNGATQCTIHPARGLAFGRGYVRWDKR